LADEAGQELQRRETFLLCPRQMLVEAPLVEWHAQDRQVRQHALVEVLS
jgi:hypothetical protein